MSFFSRRENTDLETRPGPDDDSKEKCALLLSVLITFCRLSVILIAGGIYSEIFRHLQCE
jgi:hypothetical protein